MAKKQTKSILLMVTVAIFMNGIVANDGAPAPALAEGEAIAGQVQDLVPTSLEMVDRAIELLSGGLSGMTPAERALFDQLYDPGNTGDVDEAFVADVLANYRRIRLHLSGPLLVTYRPDSERCQDQRLYFTDLVTIYVCPYFEIEASTVRKARVLIHEAVHMSLLVVDRPYFHKNTYSTRYRALTPRGPWTASLPLVGPLVREIVHGDTLHHPDAYAWFAVELAANQPLSTDLLTFH